MKLNKPRKFFVSSAMLLVAMTVLFAGSGVYFFFADLFEDGPECVANSASGVAHKANCRWVARMSEQNKAEYQTFEQAKTNGYRPCRFCRPWKVDANGNFGRPRAPIGGESASGN